MPHSFSGGHQNNESKIPLLVLVGPTAAGKTALAVRVARELKTDIISADSAQVYRDMEIGTAKPTEEEKKTARHHLIDLVSPDQSFSVADYQKKAAGIIKELWKNNKLPFLAGGTGLYIDAVIKGYAFGRKGGSSGFRCYYEQLAAAEGLEFLYIKLKRIDPEAASKIHPNDKRRIIRALEVYELEGKPISEQVKKTAARKPPYKTLIIGLHMERDRLYERIERRVDQMLEAGWLREVRRLSEQGYRGSDPGMQVLGYRQLYAYLQGSAAWDETVEEIKKQTRNLAKRQLTWFRRNREIEWIKITDQTSFEQLTENICFKVKDLGRGRANSN